jgi:hypothetical protein
VRADQENEQVGSIHFGPNSGVKVPTSKQALLIEKDLMPRTEQRELYFSR